ncbi:MAG: DUF3108 domain-containing protein, partial [Pseudomonadota bacterium]
INTPIALDYHPFSASDVLPYRANYNVMRNGTVRGSATKHLLKSVSDSMIEISYSSDARYLIFSDKRTELSQFSFSDGRLQSTYYRFTREGTGKERDQQLMFNQQDKTVSNGNNEVKINAGSFKQDLLDPLNYQLLMQIALKKGNDFPQYNVVNKYGDIRSYTFEILGEEEIDLPMGRFNAIKLLRKSNSKKRYTHIWMIPSLNHVLGKLQLIEEGKESFMLQLTSLEWLDRDTAIEKQP